MGEGLGGGKPAAARGERRHESRLPLIRSLRTGELLGGVTPTLTRPHQGGGKALAICEHPSPASGEREGPADPRITSGEESAGRRFSRPRSAVRFADPASKRRPR